MEAKTSKDTVSFSVTDFQDSTICIAIPAKKVAITSFKCASCIANGQYHITLLLFLKIH